MYWDEAGGLYLSLGDEQLNLRTAAEAAVALADVIERVREKHLQRAGREADAALGRRWKRSR